MMMWVGRAAGSCVAVLYWAIWLLVLAMRADDE